MIMKILKYCLEPGLTHKTKIYDLLRDQFKLRHYSLSQQLTLNPQIYAKCASRSSRHRDMYSQINGELSSSTVSKDHGALNRQLNSLLERISP
jgi:hypothetical protein